jgi:hypothetical protein
MVWREKSSKLFFIKLGKLAGLKKIKQNIPITIFTFLLQKPSLLT